MIPQTLKTTMDKKSEITSPKIVVEVKSLSVPPTVQLNSEQMQITASRGEKSSKSINGNKRKSPPDQLLIPKRSKIETGNSSNNSSAESRRKSAVKSSARGQRKIETDNSSGETHTPSITEVWEVLNRQVARTAEFEEYIDKHVQHLTELEDLIDAALHYKAGFQDHVSTMLLEILEKLKKD